MKQVLKKFLFVFVLSLFYILNTQEVKADYEIIVSGATPCQLYNDLNKNKYATGSCIYKNGNFNSYVSGAVWVDNGDKVTVLTDYEPIAAPKEGYGSECNTVFNKISVKHGNTTYTGYVCADLLKTIEITEEMKNEFIASGFTEEYSSYWEELAVLKTNHPNWKFVAIDTGLKFETAVKNESSGSKSLYQSTSSSTQGYLSTAEGNYNWEKDKFTVYDGSTWYAANAETVAYYMDPRNFLSDMYIFQFETLAYDPELHTLEGVEKLLDGAYIKQFAQYFVAAAEKHQINPLYLASLSLQEVGSTKSTAISGAEFTYDGVVYSGIYNFYNIGATSSSNPVLNGLYYASKEAKYGRPWNTEEKAIIGGAEFIASSYVKYGQNTSYFKKWNVVANYQAAKNLEYYKNYTHQYMTNVRAPSSEAISTYQSLSEIGELEKTYVFYIPVYKNMPEYTALPAKGNPNNRLKDISIDGVTIEGFESSEFEYKVYVENTTKSINLTATTINSNAKVTGTGTIELVEGENLVELSVKAQNGDIQKYNLVINRAEETGEVVYPTVEEILTKAEITHNDLFISNLTFTSKVVDFTNSIYEASATAKVEIKTKDTIKTADYLATGDTVTITSGEEVKTFSVVLYGDVSGDGKINALDLLKVQKHILKTSLLSGAQAEAADVNKDGKINALDLLRIQKTILGDAYISQK